MDTFTQTPMRLKTESHPQEGYCSKHFSLPSPTLGQNFIKHLQMGRLNKTAHVLTKVAYIYEGLCKELWPQKLFMNYSL